MPYSTIFLNISFLFFNPWFFLFVCFLNFSLAHSTSLRLVKYKCFPGPTKTVPILPTWDRNTIALTWAWICHAAGPVPTMDKGPRPPGAQNIAWVGTLSTRYCHFSVFSSTFKIQTLKIQMAETEVSLCLYHQYISKQLALGKCVIIIS